MTGRAQSSILQYNNEITSRLTASTPIIEIVDVFVEPVSVDAVVALFSLSSTLPPSRLESGEVSLEILSELFSFQGSTEVTVSVVLENGRRVVIESPVEIMLESSNSSIVSVTSNLVEAVATGSVDLTVSWVVCGMVVGTDVVRIAAVFDENIPVFEQPGETADVLENAAVGTPIFTAFAPDNDYSPSVPASQRDTEYNFAEGSSPHTGLFTLDRTSGLVTLSGPLDRETVATYEVVIEATDRSQRRFLQQLANFQQNDGPANGGNGNAGSGLDPMGSGSGASGSGGMLAPTTEPQATPAPAPPTPTISRTTVSSRHTRMCKTSLIMISS